MAINMKFDKVGNPEPLTIILHKRNGDKLGQIDLNEESIDFKDKFNGISEISFTVNKYIDGEPNYLWNDIVDFKLVYCPEWNECFEIKVEISEEDETIKNVFCSQLGQSELSQIMLYNIEINTEKDIARDDYKITVLYDALDPKKSLLNRIMEKTPHYEIVHVDSTIAKIQRTFSFDNKSMIDAFDEIAEEINCLFLYHCYFDENRKLRRTISVYDLEQNCNDCHHRGEFTDKCPKCGSTSITNGYGKDTLIFVTADELASGGIELQTNKEDVKNCFKLEAGDDLMTATVRNCNPNGTDYIWRFSDDLKRDMSDKLVEKLNSYDKRVEYYNNEYNVNINENMLDRYNDIIKKYSVYDKDLEAIKNPIIGYSKLMNTYYDAIDLGLYLKHSLMPSVEIDETNAEKQAQLLTRANLSPIAVQDLKIVSLATLNSTILSVAKVIVKSTFRVQVNVSEMIVNGESKQWRGSFIISNYSDEKDVAISNTIVVDVSDEYELFVKQKIDKILKKEDTDDVSISGLFAKEYNDFCNELKKYALNPLMSFRDACQACINILIEQGIGNEETWGENKPGAESNIYEKLYVPYTQKIKAIEAEIQIRENEVNTITGAYDTNGNLTSDGVQSLIEKERKAIQNELDFEKYLGNDLWLEFSAFRREDKYSNTNYISDGLNNAEIFKKALEFYEVASNEIYKASEIQYSISTSLNNLLAIDKFKDIKDQFDNGNWIRVEVDEKIYKLRLIEYGTEFGSFNNINVDFSEATKIKNGLTDVQSVLEQSSSMASSFSSVKRQASQGEKGNNVVTNWIENGLSATNTKITSDDNQTQEWNKNGMIFKEYDPVTETYGNEQLKIINSTIAITTDNWQTTKTAIGKYFYVDPKTGELKTGYGVNAETIVGKLLIGENLILSNDGNSMEFNDNGLIVRNDVNSVEINPNSPSIFNISNENGSIFSLNNKGELVIVGNVTTLNDSSIDSGSVKGLAKIATTGYYGDLINLPSYLDSPTFLENNPSFTQTGSYTLLTDKPNLHKVALSGSYNDLIDLPKYAEVATTGSYNDLVDKPTYAEIATSGSYNDLVDIQELKDWVLEQIETYVKDSNKPQ